FIPMHFAGIAGNPRRYADFTQFDFLKDLTGVHKFITHAALFTAVIQVLFLWNLFYNWRKGAKAPANPWNATTLEWALPSPPPAHNFGINPPLVKRGPYDYSLPGESKDFLMQHEGDEE
ncbi:MAG: cytochrome c oxidase subunit I, partial [Bryobacterales bacterium]|nr:cytochrome c oxidase subunit I [Bryobacterales bacterium]